MTPEGPPAQVDRDVRSVRATGETRRFASLGGSLATPPTAKQPPTLPDYPKRPNVRGLANGLIGMAVPCATPKHHGLASDRFKPCGSQTANKPKSQLCTLCNLGEDEANGYPGTRRIALLAPGLVARITKLRTQDKAR